MSLNNFVRCALKVSESRLSALLKGSLIISIIERIPDYQQPQQNHTDTLLGTAAAYQALLWENTTMLSTCMASSGYVRCIAFEDVEFAHAVHTVAL